MLDIVTPTFDRSGGRLLMVESRFSATPDGQLAHFTDDNLRAIVPPEGWDDYAAAWPACAELVAQLKRPAA